MVKEASVVRIKAETPATGKLPFDTSRRVDYSDYGLPPLEFLNEAPPHSEQADTELLSLATRLAEKCKEFNVTGQIKHICPGPVVTTYEFKPDPGVKYSRVVSLVDDLCLALKADRFVSTGCRASRMSVSKFRIRVAKRSFCAK